MADVDKVHKGDLYYLTLDDGTSNIVGCLTTLESNLTMDTTEVPACRGAVEETGGWKRYIPGDKSMEITFEGQVQMAENWNPPRFFDLMDQEVEVDFIIEPATLSPYTPISGGQSVTGKAWLTSFTTSMPNNEMVTYSGTLVVNGKPTSTIIP